MKKKKIISATEADKVLATTGVTVNNLFTFLLQVGEECVKELLPLVLI